MGAGRSLEAEYLLVDFVPAGEWTLVADGIITAPVDVTFEILWRRDGRDDVLLASWMTHFEPLGGGSFDAQAYEVTAVGPRVDREPGDRLVFRYTGTGTDVPMAYVPNGDGARHNGRIPYIDLPR